MKVKFTADIIDDNGNVVGRRTSEEGGIPSLDIETGASGSVYVSIDTFYYSVACLSWPR